MIRPVTRACLALLVAGAIGCSGRRPSPSRSPDATRQFTFAWPFRDGDTVLGSARVHEDGTARLEVDTLTPGSHAIAARYEGDGAYAPATSDALTQVVQPRPASDRELVELEDAIE